MVTTLTTLEMVGLPKDPSSSYGVCIPPPPPVVHAAHTHTITTTTANNYNHWVWAAVLDRTGPASSPNRALTIHQTTTIEQQPPTMVGDHLEQQLELQPVVARGPGDVGDDAEFRFGDDHITDDSHPVSLSHERVTWRNVASGIQRRWHRVRAFVARYDLPALLRAQVLVTVAAIKGVVECFVDPSDRRPYLLEALARFSRSVTWNTIATSPFHSILQFFTQMTFEVIPWDTCCGGCCGGECCCMACLS